jgi:hypothetical protein
MWGRLATCGRVVLGLVGICTLVGRRVDNPPQVNNLPHKFWREPPAGDKSPSAPASQVLSPQCRWTLAGTRKFHRSRVLSIGYPNG